MKHSAPLYVLVVLPTVLFFGGAASAFASGHAAEKPAVVEEIVEGVEVTLKLDLGTIEVINVEPTRGRTSRMSFNLNLTLDPKTDPNEVKALDAWHHRLREQVIVGVRATEIHDFIDPDLTRFRKQMLYRINRLLGKPMVTDVLFANFTFYSE
jgi:flagellar basal body-associated protein FliL